MFLWSFVAEKEGWRILKENGIDPGTSIPSFVVGPFLSPESNNTLFLIRSVVIGCVQIQPNTMSCCQDCRMNISAHKSDASYCICTSQWQITVTGITRSSICSTIFSFIFETFSSYKTAPFIYQVYEENIQRRQ